MTKILFSSALEGNLSVLENHKNDTPNTKWDDIRDDQGNTLIITAASKGKLHIIDYLVSQNATLDIKNNDGYTALEIAYKDGHPNTARGLIAHHENANIDIPLSSEELETLRK